MSYSKNLLLYNFKKEMVNKGEKEYSFSEFGSAYTLSDGYIGSIISSLNVFNLNKDWIISFYYQWRVNLSSNWNHLFAFGTHKSSSSAIDSVIYAIGIQNVNSRTTPLYIIKTIDQTEHFYEIEYVKNTKTLFVRIDNVLVNKLENIEFPTNHKGIYLNGCYGKTLITAKIRDFIFKVTYETIDVKTESSTKSNVLQNINTNLSTSNSSVLENYKYTASLVQNNVISVGSQNLKDDFSGDTFSSNLSRSQVYIDKDYLVSLHFDDNYVQDFGTLKYTWYGPEKCHFVDTKFNTGNPIKKSLYFDGEYSLKSYKKIKMPLIKDFCVEIDFIVDSELKFLSQYSRVYLVSTNINTYGEYHSTLVDMYLLPKYQDEENLVSLTIESNDLYRNTGNVIYTYGWIKRDTVYSVIYTREGNHFYIRVNDELVYDKILDTNIVYEQGYSKPNRRYFGDNYLRFLEIGLGSSVMPTNNQDKFIGYIDKFNISGVARYDHLGKVKFFKKKIVRCAFHIAKSPHPSLIIHGKSIRLKPGESFHINGFSITAGAGGAILIGGPGGSSYGGSYGGVSIGGYGSNGYHGISGGPGGITHYGIIGGHPGWYGGRLVIYSGGGNVLIRGPIYHSNGTFSIGSWHVPGGGYYGIIYGGLVTIFHHQTTLYITDILLYHIIFIGSTEIFYLLGFYIFGVEGGVIIYRDPDGGYYIGYHKYSIKIIDPTGAIFYVQPGHRAYIREDPEGSSSGSGSGGSGVSGGGGSGGYNPVSGGGGGGSTWIGGPGGGSHGGGSGRIYIGGYDYYKVGSGRRSFHIQTCPYCYKYYSKTKVYPIPSWVKICIHPHRYPPHMVQYMEEHIIVYVPCKKEVFDDDVMYSKLLPREENYQAINARGKFYKDYWREGYGAIGPR